MRERDWNDSSTRKEREIAESENIMLYGRFRLHGLPIEKLESLVCVRVKCEPLLHAVSGERAIYPTKFPKKIKCVTQRKDERTCSIHSHTIYSSDDVLLHSTR